MVSAFSARSHRQPLNNILLGSAVLVLGFSYFYFWVPDPASRLNQLGLFCSIFTISMYLSPLADLAQIIRTKSTKCLSFPLTVTTFLTSTSWVLYGLQLHDLYIMVPNLPGIVTSLLRIWLFYQYGQEPPTYRLLQA
ncbi:sugar transporter SWEET1-like [Gastrophryne carolinensis]